MNILVIGCGLTGSVIARHLAEQGKHVVIWERRDHIGGNMYDYVDESGLCVHKYGPHVFHTYDKALRDYMLRFARWVDFPITCKVKMLGKETPSPFNYKTIDDFYPIEKATALKRALEAAYPGRDKATIVELLQSEDGLVREYADFLFEHDYSLYTAKQWGISPKEIDPSVLKRVPVLFSYKDGYFDDTWQMVPEKGYTDWFQNLLRHPNISIQLNMEALDHLRIEDDTLLLHGRRFDGQVIYTGAIDELLQKCYGSLPYRGLRFEWEIKDMDRFQGAALVAYPEAEGFTRITEYSHFPQLARYGKTSLAYEYPLSYEKGGAVEPYYPLLTEESQIRHKRYMERLRHVPNLVLCGRLAQFKYYNMDQALEAALKICNAMPQ